MTNQLNLLNELHIGDTVGTPSRIVVSCFKKSERIPEDTYATWVAICASEQQRHPYVVWTVVARPEGFSASDGIYCETLMDAVYHYNKRK
jgi:hypothetical protein